MSHDAAASASQPEPWCFSHEAMTTTFRVFLAGVTKQQAQQAATTVFRELDRLAAMLTRFDACSEIGQINLLDPGTSRRVTPEVMDGLLTALWAHRETNGTFDICLGDYVDRALRRPRDGPVRNPSVGHASMEHLLIDPDSLTVGLHPDAPARLCLDLGGIGKGFALDRVVDLLEEQGIKRALLDSGTSTIYALCGEDDDGWPIGMAEQTVILKNHALSGSGNEVKGPHIIDPQTGLAVQGRQAVWAQAPAAAVADALSTAFMIMPPEAIGELCRRHPDISCFIPE